MPNRSCPVCKKQDLNEAAFLCSCGHTLRTVKVGFTVREVLEALGAPMAGDAEDQPDGIPTMMVYAADQIILLEGGRVAKVGTL